MRMRICITLFVSLLLTHIQAQQAGPVIINSGGGTAIISNNFSIDWNIGESTIIETFNGRWPFGISLEDLIWSITSGILQPIEKKTTMSATNLNWTAEEVRCYPVPAISTISIDFRADTNGKLLLQLVDQLGRPVRTKILQASGKLIYSFDISLCLPGTYFIVAELMSPEGKLLKSGIFRIVKI